MDGQLGQASPSLSSLLSSRVVRETHDISRPYDNLSAKQGHGLPLPCSVNNTNLCVSQQDADAIYRLGDWEFAHQFRATREAVGYSSLRMGPWMTEVRKHLEKAVLGEEAVRYRHK